MVCRPEAVAGGIVRVEFRDLPGQQAKASLPRHRPENPVGPHPQRQFARLAAHCGRAAGKQPDARRHPHPRGARPLHRVRLDKIPDCPAHPSGLPDTRQAALFFLPLRPATLAPKGPLARIARRYLSFPLCPLPNPYIVLRFLCRRENGQKPSGKRTGAREIRERPRKQRTRRRFSAASIPVTESPVLTSIPAKPVAAVRNSRSKPSLPTSAAEAKDRRTVCRPEPPHRYSRKHIR